MGSNPFFLLLINGVLKMKALSKKAILLLTIVISRGFMPGWSSQQAVFENEDNAQAQVAKIRKNNFSIQLSSFQIPAGQNGSDVASEELNKLIIVGLGKNYDLTKHDLFAVKENSEDDAYCAVGSFNKVDAESLCKHLGTIFPSKPYVKTPADIDNVLLDFVIHRAPRV